MERGNRNHVIVLSLPSPEKGGEGWGGERFLGKVYYCPFGENSTRKRGLIWLVR
ncbi:MAG: hypothetical protein OHK0029_14220 [Armatimonadaceae bacterium]